MDTKEQILTNELRNNLKEVIQRVLKQLHEQLEALDQRVEYLARKYKKNTERSALIYIGFCFVTSIKAPLFETGFCFATSTKAPLYNKLDFALQHQAKLYFKIN